MSFHVEIDLKDCAVLIIGAGQVAYRKAKQCRQEGARVSVLSKHFLPAFDALDIHRLAQPSLTTILSLQPVMIPNYNAR